MNDIPPKVQKLYNPLWQSLAAVVLAFGLMLVWKLLASAGMPISPRFPWMAAGASMMVYALVTSIVSLSAKNTTWYWAKSVLGYIGVVVVTGFGAYLFSKLSIDEAGSFRWIFMVVTFGYLVFISVTNLMRKIVELAMREDWQSPRFKIKKRR
jgi:hypothetical protein